VDGQQGSTDEGGQGDNYTEAGRSGGDGISGSEFIGTTTKRMRHSEPVAKSSHITSAETAGCVRNESDVRDLHSGEKKLQQQPRNKAAQANRC